MIPFLHRLPVAPTEDNPLWLVVLADMTNLMLFFLVIRPLQQSPKAEEMPGVRREGCGRHEAHPGR